MRSRLYWAFPFLLLATVANFISPAFSADNIYKQLQLPHGISIEIPGHWTVLPEESRKNLAASSQAMQDNAGIESVPSQKKGLLAVNATPSPSGAMIRVSVTVPPEYSQSDLANATPRELKELERELLLTFKKLEATGGPTVIEMLPVQIEPFKSKRALVIRYVRKSANGPSPWQVTQYKIPADNRLIELTLSYRQSDSVLWQPILERVKRSILF